MKSDTLNGVLTFVLGVMVVLCVLLAVRMVLVTHELRQLQKQATRDQAAMVQAEQIFGDAAAYNQKYPSTDLARILQSVGHNRPVNH